MEKIFTTNNYIIRTAFCLQVFVLGFLQAEAQSFSQSNLQGATIANPTSLQFGPDGKLYVAQQDGTVRIFTVDKIASNDYQVTNTETILLVRRIPNHYDDGTAKPYNINTNKRQVTGLYVAGTSSDPVIYVASSDNAIGAAEYGDVNLCTNSGVISKLYKESGTWKKIDLVRGLPRSEENHAPNGMAMYNGKLYITIGGFTNAGSPSHSWTYITEYAFSSAILSVDVAAIEAMPTKTDPTGDHPYKYDMPTLDDPTRANNPDGSDLNDPWGGNDGLNQAKIVAGEPVQLFATGFRNSYDVIITKTPGQENRMYTIDNGPNRNWGGWPVNEGSAGNTTNDYDVNETGSVLVTNYDGLEYIGNMTTYDPSVNIYYGGHPVPIRANPTGAGLYSDDDVGNRGWRNDDSNPNLPLPSDWPPLPASMANPEEGDYQDPGSAEDKSLITFNTSTNGFCEYTASGAMEGDLLAAGFNGNIYRIRLDNFGQVLNTLGSMKLNQDAPFASGFGSKPLDIIAQGDDDIFPATIWVATWGASVITIFEPQSIVGCTGADNSSLDEDFDGYNNADEIDNGTNPCSGSSKPNDNDGDYISDLNDPDDDNDGIPDTQDYFVIDPDNGLTTTIPTHYNLFNYDPGTGFYGLGFTGLMCNGTTDYITLFDEDNLIAGGAVGAFTIEEVPAGDALNNNQQYSFQFGVKTSNEGTFTVQSGILPMFFDNLTPVNNQSQGIYIGTGDQDNYLKIVLNANGGAGGFEVLCENEGVTTSTQFSLPGGIPLGSISFYITVDPANSRAFVKYSIGGESPVTLGDPVPLSGPLLDAITNPAKAMAVGVIATSNGASPFNASWDYLEVYSGWILSIDTWHDGTISEKIHLYPNPANDKVMISVQSLKDVNYTIRLYDNVGHLLHDGELKWMIGQSDNEMNISQLPPGVYFLQFISENDKHTATVKFIKE
jgi:hypothetical protein